MQATRDAIGRSMDGLDELSTVLWWLAVTFFGVGDVLTTSAAVLYVPVDEGSPVVGELLRAHGIVGLIGLKVAAFAVAYAVWVVVGEPDNVGVPLALAVLGVGFTAWNLFVLATTFPI